MALLTAPYPEQAAGWPQTGQHILAQYDDESIVVYQAYRPSIGHYAAAHGHFGGEFSFSRMSWIKPSFLWMMFRSGWGSKPDQEVTLAIRLYRTAFDNFLAQAVPSSYDPGRYASEAAWKAAVAASEVRLQWDPDHHPGGAKLERRALQLGLRGAALRTYASQAILSIEDISPFVSEQRQHVVNKQLDRLHTPRETIYPVNP